MTHASLVLLAWLAAASAAGAPLSASAATPAAPVSFEELWAAHVKADAAGDHDAAERALKQIRKLRIERNVVSQDVVGLGLVARGLRSLDSGDREAAERSFREAVVIAPSLPDAHFALAAALVRKGPFGFVSSVQAGAVGVASFVATGRGSARLAEIVVVWGLLAAFALSWAVAAMLVLRKGGLLRHDLEEWLGPSRAHAAVALSAALFMLPVAAFQGWGWLPLWACALLFSYLTRAERAIVGLLALGAIVSGPAAAWLDRRTVSTSNPLWDAAFRSIEGTPGRSSLQRLEKAASEDPQDRDLLYLLGLARKRAGLYDQAAEAYRQALLADPTDAYARNNLAGIDFARGAYDAALARYKEGTSATHPGVAATSYYNLSLAHLQKFDYKAYEEAKANADRLAPRRVSEYEGWKYDTGDYAAVDLAPEPGQIWTKFAGTAEGTAVRNVALAAPSRAFAVPAGAWLNRFSAAVPLLAVVAFVVARVRGSRAFTLNCEKCGMTFCRHCHLGAVAGGLCSQCYHLFVVRDGVSGPARNRKNSEVHEAEARRGRVFRWLSVFCPGAGHVYRGRTLAGFAVLAAWWGVITLAVALRVVPLTDVAGRLVPIWPWALLIVAMAVVWLLGHRLRPDVEVLLPARRPLARRTKVA